MAAAVVGTVVAVVLLVALRDGESSPRTRFVFQDGQLVEQEGEVPVATRYKLLELARSFHISGQVEVDPLGEVFFDDNVARRDQQRIRNALVTGLPRPHC